MGSLIKNRNIWHQVLHPFGAEHCWLHPGWATVHGASLRSEWIGNIGMYIIYSWKYGVAVLTMSSGYQGIPSYPICIHMCLQCCAVHLPIDLASNWGIVELVSDAFNLRRLDLTSENSFYLKMYHDAIRVSLSIDLEVSALLYAAQIPRNWLVRTLEFHYFCFLRQFSQLLTWYC